jgi:ABC-2 type transport system permease protein
VVPFLGVFVKELHALRRQPRLVLGLLFGPTLVLLVFGLGYQGTSTGIPTLIVAPPEAIGSERVQALVRSASPMLEVREVLADEGEAMRRLRAGEVRLVEVLPEQGEEAVLAGERIPIAFRYEEINPLEAQGLRFAGYIQTLQMNAALLEETAAAGQGESRDLLGLLADADQRLELVGGLAEQADRADLLGLRASLRQARQAVLGLADSAELAGSGALGGAAGVLARPRLRAAAADLAALEAAAAGGSLSRERQRIERTRSRLAELEDLVRRLGAVPPEVIVSPLEPDTLNLAGEPLDLMVYYAPAVMALILQHIAITLAALALVRERLQGSLELVAVSPATMGQVLAGKYLAFGLFVGLIAAALLLLMRWLAVPQRGDLAQWVGLLTLFLLASLGLGFCLSVLSRSESQAVQLSMLVLLLSIFFSGFFLPLDRFIAPVRALAALLPLSHAIPAFQAIMLRGRPPEPGAWLALAAIAIVTAAWVAWRWRRPAWEA